MAGRSAPRIGIAASTSPTITNGRARRARNPIAASASIGSPMYAVVSSSAKEPSGNQLVARSQPDASLRTNAFA
jgi:hypothetical protein